MNTYKAKYWLNKCQYLAEIKGKLVIVTLNEKKEIIRVAIFGEERNKQ